MNESTFTQAVNKRLSADVYPWKIRDDYQRGVPDSFYIASRLAKRDHQSNTLFVEYKYLKALPKRETTLIIPKLTEQQVMWAEMVTASNVSYAVIIGFGSKGCILNTLNEIKNGITAKDFQLRLRPYKELAEFIEGLVFKKDA